MNFGGIMKNKKLLLHVCCAPCLIGTMMSLGENDFETSYFWYNPNIGPFEEYKLRLDALIEYMPSCIVKDGHGLVLNKNCDYCYKIRLKETAKYAGENNFDFFTTTLLVSPYQNHEKIKQAGEKYAGESGAAFFGGDFRENFRAGQKTAREKNIYMQKYCGCVQ